MERQQLNSGTTKRKKSAARKRIRLVSIFVLALSAWAGVTAWGQSEKFNEKMAIVNQLQAELQQVERLNEQLKQEVDRLNDPEYREELARKDFYLAKPGETVFDIPKSRP